MHVSVPDRYVASEVSHTSKKYELDWDSNPDLQISGLAQFHFYNQVRLLVSDLPLLLIPLWESSSSLACDVFAMYLSGDKACDPLFEIRSVLVISSWIPTRGSQVDVTLLLSRLRHLALDNT